MAKIFNLSEQPSLLTQYLQEIRSKHIQRDPLRFRRNIERIGEIMAYEVSKTLTYRPQEVETPLAKTEVPVIRKPIVLATVLRAGLPMHQGFLNMYDLAENAFLSAYRKMGENGLEIVSEYLAAPDLTGKTLILVDPMLATGMSMDVAYKALLSHGQPDNLHLCSIIASQQAVQYLNDELPMDACLWCAAIDPTLNDQKYIVPGLGDAGDLCFGTKL